MNQNPKKEKKKRLSVAAISTGVVVSVVLFATAGSLLADTPLYISRMEQANSKMNFLPTSVKNFFYTTEQGHAVNCSVGGYCGRSQMR